uniref:Uncharacterized protein n=1 Tax=Spodoptera litura male-killing virus TaxID=2996810 RepID=A0AA86JBX7_9VIRU|nr:hypothetical protein [Spodoptera litura male-killing virus]
MDWIRPWLPWGIPDPAPRAQVQPELLPDDPNADIHIANNRIENVVRNNELHAQLDRQIDNRIVNRQRLVAKLHMEIGFRRFDRYDMYYNACLAVLHTYLRDTLNIHDTVRIRTLSDDAIQHFINEKLTTRILTPEMVEAANVYNDQLDGVVYERDPLLWFKWNKVVIREKNSLIPYNASPPIKWHHYIVPAISVAAGLYVIGRYLIFPLLKKALGCSTTLPVQSQLLQPTRIDIPQLFSRNMSQMPLRACMSTCENLSAIHTVGLENSMSIASKIIPVNIGPMASCLINSRLMESQSQWSRLLPSLKNLQLPSIKLPDLFRPDTPALISSMASLSSHWNSFSQNIITDVTTLVRGVTMKLPDVLQSCQENLPIILKQTIVPLMHTLLLKCCDYLIHFICLVINIIRILFSWLDKLFTIGVKQETMTGIVSGGPECLGMLIRV